VNDTIYALSSGRPPAGIAVIRISGDQAFEISRLFIHRGTPVSARRPVVRTLADPASGDLLDRALVLHFPGPGSATGEDVAEWHCHGGQAVVRAILGALERLGSGRMLGVREAQPGEFTRRAFENGRIDLNEAEGLADLLSAETESQRRAAMVMAEGHFSRRLAVWGERLLHCAAMAESLLDFSDEDDVPAHGLEASLREEICALDGEITAQLAVPPAERIRDGLHLVLAGPPNAGKSTLLNALAGREAAIVSDIAGTTRDRIEVPVDIGGVAFVITDTAGLADATDDVIERIGVDRARSAIDACDILLWLGPPEDCPRADAIRVAAQIDRRGRAEAHGTDVAVSALTGANMALLRDRILATAQQLLPREGEYALHKRQRDGVAEIARALRDATIEPDMLILAEHLRAARKALDPLTGRAGVEDMLDSLFGRFCIGK